MVIPLAVAFNVVCGKPHPVSFEWLDDDAYANEKFACGTLDAPLQAMVFTHSQGFNRRWYISMSPPDDPGMN